MNTVSRTLAGLGAIIIGTVIITTAFFESLWLLAQGVPLFFVGIFIFFNKKEDQIEQIKSQKEKK